MRPRRGTSVKCPSLGCNEVIKTMRENMLTEKVFPAHPKVGLEVVGTTDLWYAQGGIDALAFNQPTNQLFAF